VTGGAPGAEQPTAPAADTADTAGAAVRDITAGRQAEEQIRRTAALLEAARDAIFVRDLDGRITYWNAGAERTYGYTRAQAVGQISHDLLSTRFPEPLASIEAATTRSSSWDGELTQRCADGRTITVESRWAAERAPDGSLPGFMEVNRDITARKETEREMRRAAEEIRSLNATLEQQVQQRTIHLERANTSLEAFAYSVAHDLRTPLRGISGFAEVLVEDYGDQLDETGRKYAARVQAGCAARMAALIDDLLNLSQVTRAEMNLQDVDLSAEVTAICDQLAARDPGRQVRVTVQDGVRVTADKSLIRGVLENLLESAWKFTAQREDAVIEFASTPVDDAPICCYVRDNGVGFDPAYTGKLFQPFQRLHDASDFPGTGIGLASVQRIIDRHGGRTWAEGAIDSGATIYFTLNAKGPHA
jgi:PAS domain S-box-containing protein